MPRPNRAALAGLVATAALVTSACSSADDSKTVDEPSFSAVETTTAASSTASASTSSAATSSNATSSSSSASSSTATETSTASEAPAAKGSFNQSLDNGDGTYRLSPYPPGPGVTKDETATFRNLEPQGFSRLEVTVLAQYMNGNMQYLLQDSRTRYELQLQLNAEDLAGEKIYSACRIDYELLDVNGNPISLPDGNVKGTCDLNDNVFRVNLDTPGEFTMIAKIYQPGYEPLVIKQPIIVVE